MPSFQKKRGGSACLEVGPDDARREGLGDVELPDRHHHLAALPLRRGSLCVLFCGVFRVATCPFFLIFIAVGALALMNLATAVVVECATVGTAGESDYQEFREALGAIKTVLQNPLKYNKQALLAAFAEKQRL